jgi:hypothetical protein
MGLLKKLYYLISYLCDPLWFNEIFFTTKGHKGYHEGSQRSIPVTD